MTSSPGTACQLPCGCPNSEEQAQLSFWDALIVEAARRAGAARIVSEDFQSGRQIAGITIENPFAAIPA